MSISIKKHPNGYAVIAEPEDQNIYQSLSDYDEYLGNSFSFNTDKISDYFKSANNFMDSILSIIEEPDEDVGTNLKKRWEQAKETIKGTHTINDSELTYWDDNANKIYQQLWKPVVEAHLEFMKQSDISDIEEFVENLDDALTTENFKFISGLALELDENEEYFPEQERKKWVDKLTERLAEYEKGITVSELDEIINLYLYGDKYIYNWYKFSMIPDPDYYVRVEKTVEYYLENHPYLLPVYIVDSGYCSKIKYCSQFDLVEGFMFLDDQQIAELPEKENNLFNYVNSVLGGDFYTADLIFIVPEGKNNLYPDAEYSRDLKAWVVKDIDSCGFILGEDEALNYFDYIANEPPLHEVYNYTALGQVKTV